MNHLFRSRIGLICLFTTLLFFSCKKIEEKNITSTESNERTDALEKLKTLVAENPDLKKIIIPVNVTVPMYFSDVNGNQITSTGNTTDFTEQCMDPGDMDFPPSATIQTVAYNYDCNNGYNFTVTAKVSVPLNLYNTNPNTGQLSRGRIRIRNASNTILYSNLNITPINITLLGDDPATGNTNALYSITYSTGWIAKIYITPTYPIIEHSIVCQTDCVDAPSVTAPYVNSGSLDIANACQRIDPVAINIAEISGGTYITNGMVHGFGNILFVGGCPYPSSYSDRQEVQLRCVEPSPYFESTFRNIQPQLGTWPGSPVTANGYLNPFNVLTQAGTIGLYDSYYIRNLDITVGGTIKHGAYKVRYRNVMTGGCTGPWSPEYTTSF